ncbi:GH36-type glycosyl hydrolase domain-containing protein [Bacillus sp. NEB1478]|uniref:GH36-type glycosyl hydrolase domain-containing protein n=1 Tax=Bacillus sp. NEB1478 TaxID=3073816 RepID=UPI0028732B3A|nr:amylo-alpha-1,6-glucosidase [Bacillus sp. NEB1478]WNB91167.1 amylo-alpha-1,6-glucosidase [Bacillus sp. NEB1478]
MTTKTRGNFEIKAGDVRFTFLNTGDIFEASYNRTMINQWLSNPIDGALNNLYLRLFKEDGISAAPLLGIHSDSKVSYTEQQVFWEGAFEEVTYKVTFTLTDKAIWFWNVELTGSDIKADIIYGQDVGLADRGAVRTNEAYMAQYVDHRIFEDEKLGYVVCSRQNQPNGTAFPYMQQGSLTKAIGYSTDGYQFFGRSYKETDTPEALFKQNLVNEVYQYEFAYTALQTELVDLDGTKQFVFYGCFKEDHAEAVTDVEFTDEILDSWNKVQNIVSKEKASLPKVTRNEQFAGTLKTSDFTIEEVTKRYPDRILEEYEGDTLLSFFTPTYEHIVLKEKERIVERPHGHILVTGNNVHLKEDTITTTSYMYGLFNSQLVVGNTSFHKMLTNARNALNIMKTSGQRIYVEIDGRLKLLTMPSLFEMGFNFTRWYYKTDGETFIITNFTTVDTPEVQLELKTESGRNYRFVVTNQVSMNNMEYEVPFKMETKGDTISFFADPSSDSGKTYKQLSYRMKLSGTEMKVTDETFFGDNIEPLSASLVVCDLEPTNEWMMTIQGLIYGKEIPLSEKEAEAEIQRYREFIVKTNRGFHLSKDGNETEELQKMNALAHWYTHNMLIHYSVPHGLEQYGGAAWGTRDVCQGPAEYFLATQHYDAVKEILLTVYSHQYEETGNWPQWFMFDQYYKFQQEESHGDIIVWPLKAVTDYLAATNDFSILDVTIPYTDHSFGFTDEKVTLFDHIQKQIDYMKANFLHDTHLSSYGDGDWDDTLQPANPQLKKFMVSSWTVALTYQVMNQFSSLLKNVNEEKSSELKTLAENIKNDYEKYMLQNDVIPGFVFMENADEPKLMLHPTDNTTGINYRLLPMTRSMIAELLTPEQAQKHLDVIMDKFYCPDGVRLMDKPAHYKGGVSTHFKRAEQASNFGREIGLQYVHAHIRFVEAMAKLGKTEEVWSGLEKINPVMIQDKVPNAERRQSNAYFSSSDGDFKTRYEAQERFGELKKGEAKVKGGWRIYSSGPGIYMNQLITNCLGIRPNGENLILDPVLSDDMDGIEFQYMVDEKQVTFVYHKKNAGAARLVVNGKELNTTPYKNVYREGGVVVNRNELISHLSAENHTVEIYF